MKKLFFGLIIIAALSGCENNHGQEKHLRGNPADARLANVKGLLATADQAFLGAGDYEKALSFYDKVLAKDPANLRALFRSGVVLRKIGSDDKAKGRFVKYIKQAPLQQKRSWQNKSAELYDRIKIHEAQNHIRAILAKRHIRTSRKSIKGVKFLIDCLEDDVEETRQEAIDRLFAITGQKYNYWARGSESERAESVRRWREWNNLRTRNILRRR